MDGNLYCTMTPLNQDKTVPPGIYVIDLAKKTVAPVMQAKGEHAPALAPYGKSLAFLRNDELIVRDLLSGEEVVAAKDITTFRWTNEARLLAVRQVDLFTHVGDRGYRDTFIEIMDSRGHVSHRFTLNRIYMLQSDVVNLPPVSLPDFSNRGVMRMVYEWEGALYLVDFSALG
jgi:hypothetical protein